MNRLKIARLQLEHCEIQDHNLPPEELTGFYAGWAAYHRELINLLAAKD